MTERLKLIRWSEQPLESEPFDHFQLIQIALGALLLVVAKFQPVPIKMNKNTKKTAETFEALGIDSQEALEQEIQLQLKYLVEEGFAIELPNGNFRMKTQEELEEEIEAIK